MSFLNYLTSPRHVAHWIIVVVHWFSPNNGTRILTLASSQHFINTNISNSRRNQIFETQCFWRGGSAWYWQRPPSPQRGRHRKRISSQKGAANIMLPTRRSFLTTLTPPSPISEASCSEPPSERNLRTRFIVWPSAEAIWPNRTACLATTLLSPRFGTELALSTMVVSSGIQIF